MRKKLPYLVVLALIATSILAACGDNTATTAPAATTAAATTAAATTAAATTAAATTAAATTAAATTAAATTAAATTAAATTAAATTAAAATTTAAATTAAATTAASGTGTADAAGIFPFEPYGALPAGAKKGGNLNSVSLTKQLTATLHPYPQAVDYTASWTDASSYLFGANLMEYDVNALHWKYAAATKLEIGADNKTYTFTLRDGLKYSDGSAITADDYAYAYSQAVIEDKANPDNNYVDLDSIQKLASFTASGNQVICKTNDVLSKNLALSYCVTDFTPIKKSLWSKYPFYDNKANPEILAPTVTSGPYSLKSFKLDESIVLQANPNYYKGAPNFDTITLLPAAQPTNAYDSVKAGQNQFANNISASQYNDAKTNATTNLYRWPAVNGTYRDIEFNTTRAPFNDKVMRQAVAYAIDRQGLLNAADAGLGTITDSFILPNNTAFYNPNVTKYPYSLDKAKQVLKDAGYTLDGDTLKDKSGKAIEFTVVFPTSSNPRKLIATYLQQQLKQIGIKVNVDGQEFNAFVDKITKRDFDLSLSAYGGGFPDPDGAKGQYKTKEKGGTQNVTGYSNPTVDDLFDKGIKETNDSTRKEDYFQIQKALSDDLPVFFLYSLDNYSVTAKTVLGAKPSLFTNLYDGEAISRWALSN